MIGVNEREGDILDQYDGEKHDPNLFGIRFFFVYHLIDTEKQKKRQFKLY